MTDSIAWAAGLFEGEGSFSMQLGTTRGSTFHTPVASLQMNDEDVVRRFAEVIQIGSARPLKPRSASRYSRQPWVWRAHGGAAIEVMQLLLPYLGSRRSARAGEIIALYISERTRLCEQCGEEMLARDPRRRFCSERCSKRWHWANQTDEQRELGRVRHREYRARLRADERPVI